MAETPAPTKTAQPIPDPAAAPAVAVSLPGDQITPEAWMRVFAVVEKLAASSDLDELLALIIDAMRDLLHAERATVFQFDAGTEELFIRQAHGFAGVRFPITKGIAGEAARNKQIINVPDAWEDPRFNPEFDKKSGFRTRGLLTIPMVSFDGGLEGVVQALNKGASRGGAFDKRDEVLARLLASSAAIGLRRARLIASEIRKNEIESALNVAKSIQKSTWPKELPRVQGYSIAAESTPAEETGGDAFDLIDLGAIADQPSDTEAPPRGKGVVLLVGDATGHGIGPALCAQQARAMVRMGARLGASIQRIAEHLNSQLCDDLPPGRFITAFIGLLDPEEHAIHYCSPGQAPLLVVRADGRFEELAANAMPMGIAPDLMPDAVEPIRLGVGDVFLLLSDGYIEAQDPDNKQFGVDRTIDTVKQAMSGDAATITAAVNRAVRAFVRGRPFGDDQTAVVVKRER